MSPPRRGMPATVSRPGEHRPRAAPNFAQIRHDRQNWRRLGGKYNLPMQYVAQFVHRYPPAVGGTEAYTERLCRDLASHGHRVHFWTTTAIDLRAFWESGHAEV